MVGGGGGVGPQIGEVTCIAAHPTCLVNVIKLK